MEFGVLWAAPGGSEWLRPVATGIPKGSQKSEETPKKRRDQNAKKYGKYEKLKNNENMEN